MSDSFGSSPSEVDTTVIPAIAIGAEGVRSLVGVFLGPTEWVSITQERVNKFAEATDDHQWIHVDVERAAKESSFGGTIAHGFLTLSLIPFLLPRLVMIDGFAMGVNYGSDKVRFPAPVPVGSRVRAHGVIDEVTDIAGGIHIRLTVTIELDGSEKPACVATVLLRRYL
ncbi:MaoC family dehydratase [Nocardia sp. NPDC059239]|uniref:MaoC family dehydratase n=1 Tax=unclassified Nocardia TaxID=2637762 RepID=UPI00369C6BD8